MIESEDISLLRQFHRHKELLGFEENRQVTTHYHNQAKRFVPRLPYKGTGKILNNLELEKFVREGLLQEVARKKLRVTEIGTDFEHISIPIAVYGFSELTSTLSIEKGPLDSLIANESKC